MKKESQFRQALVKRLPLIVFILLLIQPFMDILSYWVLERNLSSAITLALRLGFFGAALVLGFSLSRRKKVYWIAAAVMALLWAGHVFAAWQFGYQDPVGDLTNYIRVIQLPFLTLCFITFLRENEDCYRAITYGFLTNLVVILLSILLSWLTGTMRTTYADGLGVTGWFYFPNSQSAILTALVPVACSLLYRRRGLKSPLFWVVLLAGFLDLYLTGTRLCYLGLAATGFGLGLSMILIRPGDWRRACAFFAVTIVFLGFMPLSPMVQHQKSYERVQTDRQERIDDLLKDCTLPEQDEDLSPEELERRKALWVETLTPIYETYAPDFVEIFGAKRTIEMYDYSWDIKTITALRPRKLQFGRLLMDQSPFSARLFGVELSRFTVGENTYDVENDFHGIYFLYGAFGLAAMLLFLLYFVVLIVKALIRDFRTYFTLESAGWGIALIMYLIHAYCTAGVLRRPNGSVYFSVVLAVVYYLVKLRKYPKTEIKAG